MSREQEFTLSEVALEPPWHVAKVPHPPWVPLPVVFLLMAFTLQLSVFQETMRHQNCMNKQQFIDRGAKPHKGQHTFKQFNSKVIWYCCKCQHNVIKYMKIVSSILYIVRHGIQIVTSSKSSHALGNLIRESVCNSIEKHSTRGSYTWGCGLQPAG